MKRPRHLEDRSGLELCNDAVFLLRRVPAAAWLGYLIGALPFLLGGLFFWSDMSRSADAAEHLAPGALGLTLLFLWMKFWQADFCQRLLATITGRPAPPWTARRVGRALMVQTAIQPWGLLLIPVAAFFLVPLPWVLGFFQNAALFAASADDQPSPMRRTVRRAWQQATLWPGQNFAVLAILKLFALFVFLNVALTGGAVAFLAKTLFDLSSAFSLSEHAILNSTYLAAVLAITTLVFDPLLKAVYVLRCFHGESLRSGEDLRTELRFLRAGPQLAGLIVAFLLALPARAADEAPPAAPPNAAPVPAGRAASLPPAELDRAIEHTLSRREYSWRLPRDAEKKTKPEPDENSLIVRWRKMIDNAIKSILDGVGNLISRFIRFLTPRGSRSGSPMAVDWALFSFRVLLVLVVSLIVAALAVLLWRWWSRRRAGQVIEVVTAVPAMPDLTQENVSPDQLPEDEWLRLARELWERGELRLALRAFYLSGLAHLGRRGLLSLTRSKSNRDYQRELLRRAHALPQLPPSFAGLVVTFERGWYGRHAVDAHGLEQFALQVEQLKTC